MPRDPLQNRSREKRARLKAAGLTLFREKGDERTSIDAIARKVPLAVGKYYQHFRLKKQLLLQQLPGARPGVDIEGLASVMDPFFWNFLRPATSLPQAQLSTWIDSSVHVIYHALFVDAPLQTRRSK